MKCATHLEFFNDVKYLVVGDETYELIRYKSGHVRACKDCCKKIRDLQAQKGTV